MNAVQVAKWAVAGGIAVVLAAVVWVGLVVVWPLLNSAGVERDLNEHGLTARAKVLSIQDTGTRINTNPMVNLRLEVQLADHPPYQVTMQSVVGLVDLPQFQPGATLAVKVDPADHQRVALARER